MKEADKLVWLYTEKLGKVSAVAKGAKRSKSKFLSSTLPFCYGEYVLYKGKSLYIISDSEIINSFQGLLENLDDITYASYLCELIDISMVDDESNREFFKDAISAFYLLSNKAIDPETLARAFEVKLLAATGYSFSLNNCCLCKKSINSSNYVSYRYSGGICTDCAKTNGMYISYATYNALKFLSVASIDKVLRVVLSKQVKEELAKILSIFIVNNYGRKPKSLEIFDYLKRSDKND
jgi:DNA repair protein RecO (recombination protein O)